MSITIEQAVRDQNLFRPFFGDSLRSWQSWLSALRVLYGLPIRPVDEAVVRECTGRDSGKFPSGGFDTALFLTGRRSGKSRIAATIGAYEAVLAGHEKKLSRGEKGIVPIIAPTKRQGQIVKNYLRSIFDSTPMLQAEVTGETREGFELRSGVCIEVLAGDWRTVRGFTLLAAIVDEAAFFGLEDESKVRSDTELMRALKPALATVGGRLVAISSPYAKKGWCYRQWKNHFGNDTGRVLVWNCPSRTMNPLLPQSVVDDAMAEDRQAALSEYGGQFRDDISAFIDRSIIEFLVATGRRELLPREKIRYFAFADVSGGRHDDFALAIAHRGENRKVVIDFLKRYGAPCNPITVIEKMAGELRRYNLRRVVGDNYSAEFVASVFRGNGILYHQSEKNKNTLYAELLPVLCSQGIELLDDPMLVDQLSNLERRTRSGGKDVIDHPTGGKDDLSNVVAGVTFEVSQKRLRAGAIAINIF